MYPFDPESIDLAHLSNQLRELAGRTVSGEIIGLTILRDEVARLLDCSQLEAENLVDTMVTRGFLTRHRSVEGDVEWQIGHD